MDKNDDSSRRKEWNASYERGENNILYPQNQVIRFINRHVVKRKSFLDFENILGISDRKIKCLDFACGIGTHTIFCEEFNIECYCLDISEKSIEIARENANKMGLINVANRFSVIENDDQIIEFNDDFFDISIAESCLDSMPFFVAKKYFLELKRVTRFKIYFSCISSRISGKEAGDEVVTSQHENGTIQGYFDLNRILNLTSSRVENFSEFTEVININSANNEVLNSRFYCVLDL